MLQSRISDHPGLRFIDRSAWHGWTRAVGFEEMWRDLSPIGRAASGGYFRQPFTSAERECAAWFVEQSARRGLTVETDGIGNMVAWWGPADGPAVVTGSHLDSVLDGGAFDGPLGVVSALAAVDLLRARGVQPDKRLGVSVFVEEEGSRFPLACLGSRLAVGTTTPDQAATMTDRDGVSFEAAMVAAGLSPDLGPSRWLRDVSAFVELHVEQGRHLVDVDEPVALASQIWPHGRYRFEFTGEANHAGTTRMEDRRDPMLSYAVTALAANKQARLAGQRATFGRVAVEPNGTNAIPSKVTAWLDARCDSPQRQADLVAAIERQARERCERDGTSLVVVAESVSAAVEFDPALADQIGGHLPRIPTQAGHDAGILSAAGIPTAMLFVRNPTGVSHSPAEHAELHDCLAGVDALAAVLEGLIR